MQHGHCPHAADSSEQHWWPTVLRGSCKLMPHVPEGSVPMSPLPPPQHGFSSSARGFLPVSSGPGRIRRPGASRGSSQHTGARARGHGCARSPRAPRNAVVLPGLHQASQRATLANVHQYLRLFLVGFRSGKGWDKRVCGNSKISICALQPLASGTTSHLQSRSEGVLLGDRAPGLVILICPTKIISESVMLCCHGGTWFGRTLA